MATKVFYHICAINNALDVVKTHVMMIHISGLYDEAAAIYCCICGEEPLISEITQFLSTAGKKFVIHKVAPGDTSYERLTLLAMHDLISPIDYVLYIHSKNVTYKNDCVEDWSRMLSYFVIKYHDTCKMILRSGYDAVGCNYHNGGGRYPYHFSGNFWWTRGSYFLSLPRNIGPNYYDPEFYLCQKNPRVHCIYSSDKNHHSTPWKMCNYVDHKALLLPPRFS